MDGRTKTRRWKAFGGRGMRLALVVAAGLTVGVRGVCGVETAGGAAALARPMPIGDAEARMTSAQCVVCHPMDAVLSHRVGVVPKMTVPAAFPLEGGKIHCTTCHKDTFGAHAGAEGALLRVAGTGRAFCVQCHTQTTLSRGGEHPTALARAHLCGSGGGAKSDLIAGDDGVKSCLSCHDGTIAPDAFAGSAAGTGSSTGGGKGHPVGVAYPAVTLRRGDAVFKATATINVRVRLRGGQVTCNSCHSLYSTLPGLLVMKNDNSGLCVSCHAQ